VVDTLRADRLGSYGNTRGLTPFLDALAARGVRFANAHAASSWTNPSVASIFTSRHPSEHTVTSFDSRLPAGETTLAERLAQARYRQVGFVANFRLSRELGFGRGFDEWFPYVEGQKTRLSRMTTDAETFLDLAWLPASSRWWRSWTRRPSHLYFHCMEPHAPYLPPADVRTRFAGEPPPGLTPESANDALTSLAWDRLDSAAVAYLASLYDAEVADLDAELRSLFASLDAEGLLANAVVVVTADHGEEFREHGLLGHGTTLYEEELHVPLIIVAPGLAPGTVIEEPVSLVDLAPTILDLLGLSPEPHFEGHSLASRARGGPAAERDVVAELVPTGSPLARHRATIIRDHRKLITFRNEVPPVDDERFDLTADPRETAALKSESAVAAFAPLAEALHEDLATFAARASPPDVAQDIPQSTRDRLRALGYAVP
jgi:arylsulfatase A-like enzyme